MIVEMDGLAGMMPALGVLLFVIAVFVQVLVFILAYVPRRVAERNATRFPTPDFPVFKRYIYCIYIIILKLTARSIPLVFPLSPVFN